MNLKDQYQYAQINFKTKIKGWKNTMIISKCPKDQKHHLILDLDKATGR